MLICTEIALGKLVDDNIILAHLVFIYICICIYVAALPLET